MSMQVSDKAPDPTWWTDPWWEEDQYQKESGLSLQQIRAAIEDLKRLFTKEWVQAAFDVGPPNAVISILYGGRGLWPFGNLMWLGRIASAVVSLPGVQRRARELAGPKTCSALLELEVASWFVEKGWHVEFLKPSGERRTPDLLVTKEGLAIPIECKRFQSEQWEDWTTDLSLAVIRGIDPAPPGFPRFNVLFERRLSDLVWDDHAVRDAVREVLAERIIDAVREVTRSVPPRSTSIPGIAEIKLLPDDEGSGINGVGGIEVSPQAKMRRIVRNGVLEAAQQLQYLGPGAVVIKADFTPPKELVEAALLAVSRANNTLLRSVAVVAITASAGSPAVIWRNPDLSQHPVRDNLIETFTDLLLAR